MYGWSIDIFDRFLLSKDVTQTPVSPSVSEMESLYANGRHLFLEDVPLVEVMYLVFTRMPGESNRRDPGLCYCVYETSFER